MRNKKIIAGSMIIALLLGYLGYYFLLPMLNPSPFIISASPSQTGIEKNWDKCFIRIDGNHCQDSSGVAWAVYSHDLTVSFNATVKVKQVYLDNTTSYTSYIRPCDKLSQTQYNKILSDFIREYGGADGALAFGLYCQPVGTGAFKDVLLQVTLPDVSAPQWICGGTFITGKALDSVKNTTAIAYSTKLLIHPFVNIKITEQYTQLIVTRNSQTYSQASGACSVTELEWSPA